MNLMLTARTSLSIGLMVLAMLCVLELHGPGWADNPPAAAQAAKPSANALLLRNDPALQVKLTVNFKRPKAQDIIERLRKETKLDLTLADNIDREQPALGGFSGRNVPAWIILDELAKSKIIQGSWERSGNGYRLSSSLPPADLANASSPTGPANLVWRYFLFATPLLALFGILLLVRCRRRSQLAIAAVKQTAVPKQPSPV